ncbi:MAG: hypothetical protein E3K36_01475 [Candidatus Brocadia sp.]|nr:hypothetical protein [Candidatus Brocadia sp.]
MTKTDFNSLLHRTDEKFQKCWEILGTLKTKPNKSLQLFQPMLCDALFDLSNSYRVISQERKRLISKKQELSPSWFSKRQKLLASRQEAIVQAGAIGRTMGDSFAWLLYRNDLNLLEQHLKHIETSHMPPGFGGLGEKEFVRGVPRIGNFIVLYHGATSILRLGDVSLIDVKSFRVVGIGELKTTPKKPGELLITLLVIGNKELLPAESVIKIPSSTNTSVSDFSPAMKARLDRQIDRTVKAISSSHVTKEGSQMSMRVETYVLEFEKMLRGARVGRFSYAQFGPGLLCVVYRHRKRNLRSVLLPDKQIDFTKKLDDLSRHTLKIVLPDSLHNCIDICSLIYRRNGATRFQLGTLPVFWWPLKTDTIKKLIFQELAVFTIYNPAHFISKMEAAGFTVTFEDERTFNIEYTLKNKRFSVMGLPYFLGLICFYFYKEDEVIDMINRGITAIDEANLRPNTKCKFRFDQLPCF